MSNRLTLILTAALLALTGTAMAQTPAPAPQKVRGTIASIKGDTMMVKPKGGQPVSIALQPNLTVTAVKKVKLADIKPGSYIGTAARPGPGGTLVAMEVLVFPESARGSGEGHRPWDLGPKTTMTNANVDAVVKSAKGRDLKLSYKGGSQTITVPRNAPIVTFIPATRADLRPGKHVFLTAAAGADGKLGASRVTVEKNGVVPPM